METAALSAILAFLVGILLIYIIGKVLFLPVKLIIKLIWNAVIGGTMLLVVNYLGSYIGIKVAINFVTALVVGLLGVPGIVGLLILKYIFGLGN